MGIFVSPLADQELQQFFYFLPTGTATRHKLEYPSDILEFFKWVGIT
jgi:hypothetical protein